MFTTVYNKLKVAYANNSNQVMNMLERVGASPMGRGGMSVEHFDGWFRFI